MPGTDVYVAAVREQAFRRVSDEHPDGDPELLGRYAGGVVHSFAGAIGADWAADEVVAAVERAAEVGWEKGNPFGHELRVELHDGPRVRVLHFDVKAPAGAPVWLAAHRSDGYGKAHAALAGDRRSRCGVPVRQPRTGALATPFRPGNGRCAGCAALIERDARRADVGETLDTGSSPSKLDP